MKDLLPNSTMKRINLIVPEFLYKWIDTYAKQDNMSIKDTAEFEILSLMLLRVAVSMSRATEDAKSHHANTAALIMHRMETINPARASIQMKWAERICIALEREKS